MIIKAKAGFLKQIFGAIATIEKTVRFDVKPKGITVRAVDASHIAMIDMQIHPAAFEEYTVEEAAELGVQVDKVLDVLKLLKDEDVTVTTNEKNQLVLKFGNGQRSISLTDSASLTVPNVPPLEPTHKFKMNAADLQFGFKVVKDVFELVKLEMFADGVRISSASEFASGDWLFGNDELISREGEGDVGSSYAKEYFADMLGAVVGKEVELSFKSNYPMIFRAEDERLKMMYLIAPRIEND